MAPADIAAMRAETLDSLDNHATIPTSDRVNEVLESAARALVELTALDVDTRAGYSTIGWLAPRVAGLRPEQAAAIVDTFTRSAALVAADLAHKTRRRPEDLVEPVLDAMLARLHDTDWDTFAWIIAALTRVP